MAIPLLLIWHLYTETPQRHMDQDMSNFAADTLYVDGYYLNSLQARELSHEF